MKLARNLVPALLLTLLLSSLAPAETINIDVRATGVTKLKVAVPPFGGAADLAGRAREVFVKDLRMSGIFQLVDQSSYPVDANGQVLNEVDLAKWSAAGADFVVSGSAERMGEKAVLNVSVTEIATGQVVIRQSLATAPGTVHQAVHALMNQLLTDTVNFKPIYTSKIACVRKTAGRKQLVTAWCDGTGMNAISGLGDLVLNPVWSPSGRKLAYVSYLRDNPDLYFFDLAGGGARLVCGRRGINTAPAFHPGGQLVAFTQTGVTKNGSPEIVMTDLNGDNRQVLTDDYSTDTSPSFSPDGRYMVFCSDRSGNPQIYLRNMNDGSVRRLTYSGKYNTDPVFSPRGDLVAFSCLDPDSHIYRIGLIRPDGSEFRTIAGTGRGDTQPAFSPDGRLVAFACRDGEIYVADMIGGDPVQISDGRGEYSEPTWGPLL